MASRIQLLEWSHGKYERSLILYPNFLSGSKLIRLFERLSNLPVGANTCWMLGVDRMGTSLDSQPPQPARFKERGTEKQGAYQFNQTVYHHCIVTDHISPAYQEEGKMQRTGWNNQRLTGTHRAASS